MKRSFGTAIKLWGNNRWANVSTYGKLLLLLSLAFSDPILMERLQIDEPPPGGKTARRIFDEVIDQGDQLMR